MSKKKPMKMKMKAKKVDDFSVNDKGQSKAMNIDEKNPKLAKCAERKVRAR
jgi:hypothetical protein